MRLEDIALDRRSSVRSSVVAFAAAAAANAGAEGQENERRQSHQKPRLRRLDAVELVVVEELDVTLDVLQPRVVGAEPGVGAA